ncbi:hypothetical protein BRADI_4g05909v3 [Brachypodium distachyon]|uniref:F-box domain-containing protein n=1 Tax=Brachypodium distachyon TaxID=15368 RepID=A0A2K2CKR4_BRADI|nr:hypothetical protein BRADI_4g05909v3 [Brachypodium distachyon]
MEDLPEALLVEIINRITRTSDLNSLSLVSKQFYTIEACQRSAIHVGCGLCPAREALTSLCSRFPNLWKVDIDYSGWKNFHGDQLDNNGLSMISSCCLSLTELTLRFSYCKKLVSLRLNSVPEITSSGLLSVAVGCKSLSGLFLNNCEKIGSVEWLEHLGQNGSLVDLVVNNCNGISQYDFLKFGPGWLKLRKFDFEVKGGFWAVYKCFVDPGFDPLYNAHNPSRYDFFCESLKDLRLACFETGTEVGLRFLFGKCKALEKLRIQYVHGLNDNDLIVLSVSCRNLKSISLLLTPMFYHHQFRTAFTDNGLKALAVNCPMLESVELTFAGCEASYPTEIGFTQKGLVVLVQSCPIRVLILNGANFFNDDGMTALSSAPFLETFELVDCMAVTDAGLCFIARTPFLVNLMIRICEGTAKVAELARAKKFESMIIEGYGISQQAMQGAARSVQYSVESARPGELKRMC